MKENKFLDKFSNKSNSELREIILEKEKYNSKAIDAAKELLEKREINENSIKTNNIDFESTSIKTENEEVIENLKNLPELYSKRAIIIFSILFTPLVGSILMFKNLKKVENTPGQFLVILYGIFYNKLSFWIIKYLNLNFFSYLFVMNVIGAVILAVFIWKILIGNDFQYSKKSNKSPFLIILGVIGVFIALITLLVLLN
ncbi:hypothetical protein [Wenyingzhuangia sp. IMCC45467]